MASLEPPPESAALKALLHAANQVAALGNTTTRGKETRLIGIFEAGVSLRNIGLLDDLELDLLRAHIRKLRGF